MRVSTNNQVGFSSILFDTLFGLVIFLSIEPLFDFDGIINPIAYIFSIIVVVHWWLLFKSADDMFGADVEDSVTDVLFGIAYLIILEYYVIASRELSVTASLWWIVALFGVDLVWALLWRFVGEWNTKVKSRINIMEQELNRTIGVDLVFLLVLFVIAALSSATSAPLIMAAYFVVYTAFIVLTFRKRILDIRWY